MRGSGAVSGQSAPENLIASSMKQGKLVEGSLVGASDGEDEEGISAQGKRIIEALRTGLTLTDDTIAHSPSDKLETHRSSLTSGVSTVLPPPTPQVPTIPSEVITEPRPSVIEGKKPSKFKASRAQLPTTSAPASSSAETSPLPDGPSRTFPLPPAKSPKVVRFHSDFVSDILPAPGGPPLPPGNDPSLALSHEKGTPIIPGASRNKKVQSDSPPMLQNVKESSSGLASTREPQQEPPTSRKVSRFKAERMYGLGEDY